jgi:hypothetical protein
MKTRRFQLTAIDKKDLVLKYLNLTQSIHKLTDIEIKVACEFILSGDFSTKNKTKIREVLDMNKSTFNVVIHRLRLKNFFVDKTKINQIFVPNIDEEGATLTFEFQLKPEYATSS